MTDSLQRPYKLDFRDRFNVPQFIKISQAERDKLYSEGAIAQKALRRRQYYLIGHGAAFFRDEVGILQCESFVYEPARQPKREFTALDNLRAMGLHKEASELDVTLNCEAMLHRAPVNSRSFQPACQAVLLG